MNLRKEKKKNIFKVLIKNAVKFVGSTVGIVKEEETEDTLPPALYPAHFEENSVLDESESSELSVAQGDGEIPMWMRVAHAPNLSKRKLKRKIYRVIKDKNRMLKIIRKNESRSEYYAKKLERDMSNAEELYRLRKQYVEAVLEKKEVEDKLNDKTSDFLKYRMLSKMMSDNSGTNDLLAADFNALRDEIHHLQSEIERIKKESKKTVTKKPKEQKTEPNEIISSAVLPEQRKY